MIPTGYPRDVDEELPAAVATAIGPITRVTPLSGFGHTRLVHTDDRQLVVKRMSYRRAPRAAGAAGDCPGDFERLFTVLASRGFPCPPLLLTVATDDAWYAVHAHIEGTTPDPASPNWGSMWAQAFDVLGHLSDLSAADAPWDLDATWIDVLSSSDLKDPGALELLEAMVESRPSGIRCVAHGDFAPQNFLIGSDRLWVVDWEQVGHAHPGFDAGWLLALNGIGAGPRMPPEVLRRTLLQRGFRDQNLQWYEGLGLLRLYFRAGTLALSAGTRRFLEGLVAAQIRRHATGRP